MFSRRGGGASGRRGAAVHLGVALILQYKCHEKGVTMCSRILGQPLEIGQQNLLSNLTGAPSSFTWENCCSLRFCMLCMSWKWEWISPAPKAESAASPCGIRQFHQIFKVPTQKLQNWVLSGQIREQCYGLQVRPVSCREIGRCSSIGFYVQQDLTEVS